MSDRKVFLKHWQLGDIGKAFASHNCYERTISQWYRHLELGYVTFVTYADLGMPIGYSSDKMTKERIGRRDFIKISEIGENILYMEDL